MGVFHEFLQRSFKKSYLIIFLVVICLCLIAGFFEFNGLGFSRSVINFNSRFSGALCTMSLTHYFTIKLFKGAFKASEYDPETLRLISFCNFGLTILLFVFTEVFLIHMINATTLGQDPIYSTVYFAFSVLVISITILLILHVCYVLDSILKTKKIKFKDIWFIFL